MNELLKTVEKFEQTFSETILVASVELFSDGGTIVKYIPYESGSKEIEFHNYRTVDETIADLQLLISLANTHYTMEEYLNNCLVTWNTNTQSINDPKVNAILGLAEIYEVFNEYKFNDTRKILDEMGDFMYYIALSYHLFGFDLQKDIDMFYATAEEHGKSFCEWDKDFETMSLVCYQVFAQLCGYIKKIRFHNKEIKPDVIQILLTDLLFYMLEFVYKKLPLDLILTYNIDKLRKRHGDKFKENTN